MNVVGKFSSFIFQGVHSFLFFSIQGVYSVATPFHPFGGAVDIIVVKQQDGTSRSTPWYVQFGKFQGVLNWTEKVVRIVVNGVEANFHMYLNSSGAAYFVREVDPDKDDKEYGSSRYDLDSVENVSESQNSNSEVVPVSVDEHILTVPLSSSMTSTPSERGWRRFWRILFLRVKTHVHNSSSSSNEEVCVDSESISPSQPLEPTFTPRATTESFWKQIIRTNMPTTDQIASLNLKEGQNTVNFVFCTRFLGSQKVEAHIYLWKRNTQIVISDVDGTITKSDVLGQFMPLVGKDWTHSGIAHLFCAIKENGYELLFLSARAIVQAYLTKNFLENFKQDGKSLPNGPVIISPDGLFPSLYREVIRRAPHEFKIACLEDIKALFPPDYNPFYAGFGNRDTDELSYRKIGIPKGKIFIINPKGEVAINHRIDVKSYTSLQTLVHDMFPPTSLVEQEGYNSWNYWKMPLHDDDDL